MRTIGILLAGLVLLVSGCGGSSSTSAADQQLQHAGGHHRDRPDREDMAQGGVDEGHRPDDDRLGAGRDLHGRWRAARRARRRSATFFEGAGPFQPGNDWVSDTPAYKIRITANGDKGTLYFECHYIDTATGKLVNIVAADQDVQRIDGKWLITTSAAAPATLKA